MRGLQAWNHEFFWESIQPGGGGKPVGDLLRLIERDFGSFEDFLERFKSAAASQFGSGWTWLACECFLLCSLSSREKTCKPPTYILN